METGKEYVVPIASITSSAIKKAIYNMLKEDKKKKYIIYINGKMPEVMIINKKGE